MKKNLYFSKFMSSISKNISLKTADILFEIKAIYANIKKPFKLTSGRLSPVYIDCRKIISFHKQRKKIIEKSSFCALVGQLKSYNVFYIMY